MNEVVVEVPATAPKTGYRVDLQGLLVALDPPVLVHDAGGTRDPDYGPRSIEHIDDQQRYDGYYERRPHRALDRPYIEHDTEQPEIRHTDEIRYSGRSHSWDELRPVDDRIPTEQGPSDKSDDDGRYDTDQDGSPAIPGPEEHRYDDAGQGEKRTGCR